jgi:hypothetical protein
MPGITGLKMTNTPEYFPTAIYFSFPSWKEALGLSRGFNLFLITELSFLLHCLALISSWGFSIFYYPAHTS